MAATAALVLASVCVAVLCFELVLQVLVRAGFVRSFDSMYAAILEDEVLGWRPRTACPHLARPEMQDALRITRYFYGLLIERAGDVALVSRWPRHWRARSSRATTGHFSPCVGPKWQWGTLLPCAGASRPRRARHRACFE
jgi:hypothetical protein